MHAVEPTSEHKAENYDSSSIYNFEDTNQQCVILERNDCHVREVTTTSADIYDNTSESIPDVVISNRYTTLEGPIQCVDSEIMYPDVPAADLSTGCKNSEHTKYVDRDTITCDDGGGLYSYGEYSLFIPEGAIPRNKTVTIDIGIMICTHLKLTSLLPLDAIPVSPIMQLCVVDEPKFKFNKAVKIQMAHILDITHHSEVKEMNLQFLKSNHNQPCFHTTDGLEEFNPCSNHGTIAITHFCSFCIAADKTSVDASKIYYYIMNVIPKNITTPKWDIIFCVTLYTCTRVSSHLKLSTMSCIF